MEPGDQNKRKRREWVSGKRKKENEHCKEKRGGLQDGMSCDPNNGFKSDDSTGTITGNRAASFGNFDPGTDSGLAVKQM